MRATLGALCALSAVAAASVLTAASGQAPVVYAIQGARVVPVSGPAIGSGTVVFRDGIITAVGATVDVPAGAQRARVEPRGSPPAAPMNATTRAARGLRTAPSGGRPQRDGPHRIPSRRDVGVPAPGRS